MEKSSPSKKNLFSTICLIVLLCNSHVNAQPNWPLIKTNAVFSVADTNYLSPQLLPLNVGGWEDGLYVSRNGKHLFSTYLPIDAFSWFGDISPCINFHPYYRGPLFGMDTLTNIWACPNYMHSDIIKSERPDTSAAFTSWQSSNLIKPFTFEGGACGVLLNDDTFDVFVCTSDTGGSGVDLMFMKNVPANPDFSTAVAILSTPGHEDNPHIERLPNGDLLLIFDRDRYMYYSISTDNGLNWQSPVLITNVLNDQAPYDVQPHLWFDGQDWWVYFCANNLSNARCIYKSKQMISGDWNSWGPKELVVEPVGISGGHGNVLAVGEPTLTTWGDLYFVVVYGNTLQSDTTDMFDCDPWVLKRKNPVLTTSLKNTEAGQEVSVYPNPARGEIFLDHVLPGAAISIVDMSGKQVHTSNTTCEKKNRLDVKHLQAGVYYLRVLQKNQLLVKKIVLLD